MRMTDDDARDTFKRIRWAATDGEPFCPHCGFLTVYTLAERPPRWKCGGCRRKFSLTSQALFHSRKLPVRDPRRDRVVRQWREGHVSTTDQPRSQHQSEECFR